jgi:hypothetical protein
MGPDSTQRLPAAQAWPAAVDLKNICIRKMPGTLKDDREFRFCLSNLDPLTALEKNPAQDFNFPTSREANEPLQG